VLQGSSSEKLLRVKFSVLATKISALHDRAFVGLKRQPKQANDGRFPGSKIRAVCVTVEFSHFYFFI